jgi:ADP-ribosylglycohydrolase
MIQPATLTGLAVGDALGMPFETNHFSSRRLNQWDGSFQASDFHKLDPGQWTDDTQMATALTGTSTCGVPGRCEGQGRQRRPLSVV